MLYDVVVIGGGIVGCAIARELTHFRLALALCEKEAEVGFGTTKANSGIIHGGHHSNPATLKGQLEWDGNRRWDALHHDLGFGFARVGELTVALNGDQLPVLEKILQNATAQGVPGVERWERDRVLAAEPTLTSEVIAAVYAPTTGVINPYEACYALAENAVRNGLDLYLDAQVLGLTSDGQMWTIATRQGELYSRFVINAAGIYADQVARMAGVGTFTIHPRKGEEYLLDKRLKGLVQRVIYPCPTPVSKGTLVIPTYDGTIMVGPTAEEVDDREDVSTSATGAQQVIAAVQRLVPAIQASDIIAQFAGLRAVADGDDFIIGPAGKRGFIHVAGIQSPGLTAAPAIAMVVKEILAGEGLALVERDDFVAGLPQMPRFATLSTAEQIALTQADARYRRIACRCEFVTEGEVLDAIGRGAKTLDGIKFRTRAGMGRCQGGFCMLRCMALLAQRMGRSMTELTKHGEGSWLVCPQGRRAHSWQERALITAKPCHLQPAYDVLVVGGGPAGLEAATAAQGAGAEHVLVVDREVEAGGILLQCIHSGFGLHRFGMEMTGPEYAQRVLEKSVEHGVDILADAFVLDVDSGGRESRSRVKILSAQTGVSVVEARAVVLAMGARERTRAAICIPGTRPAGIFTAGLAQRLVNLYGLLPGRRAVVLGSGDIGLIMARRLTLEGVEVAGVFEILPHANGLNRNIVQCLQDYAIPLHLSTTVVEVHGRQRVEKVTVAPVDEQQQPAVEKAWEIACDTLLISVGLIPENELSRQLQLALDPATGGPVVTSAMETSRDGIFACGNVVHIHDLVDFVSDEAALAGRFAGLFAGGQRLPPDDVLLQAGENVVSCVPQTLSSAREQVVYLRVRRSLEACTLRLVAAAEERVYERKLRYVCPAETVTLKLQPRILANLRGGGLRIDVTPR